MENLIERITEAIFRQEGMGPAYRNPGNLRGAPWEAQPVIVGGFWLPLSRAQGVAGAAHVVALHIAKGDSLRKLLTGWAPPTENDTEKYIANVKAWAEIPDVDKPLWELLEIPT
jgi:hypothetical protein